MNTANAKPIEEIIASFKEKFSNEEMCRKTLFQYRWPDGFCCPQCGHETYYFIKTRRLYECRDCRCQTSLTAGTIMHNTNLPLQYWFLAIHLAAEGIIISARCLSQTLSINYRSAHRMLHAVRRAMRTQNGFHVLSSILRTESAVHPEKVVQRTKKIMLQKISTFIRSVYRSVHNDFKQNYVDEFYFQWKNRIGPRDHLGDALFGACTVKY